MITDTAARIDKMIDDYNLAISEEGKVQTNTQGTKLRKNVDDFAFLKENVEAFKARITVLDRLEPLSYEERLELEAHTVCFYSDRYTIKIDTREDIDFQLRRAALKGDMYCTYESLRVDYDRHMAKIAEHEAAIARAEAAKAAHMESIRAVAVKTGEKQFLREYTESVTVWAMPDGSEIETRKRR